MSWKAASSSPAALSQRPMGNQARRGEALMEGRHTQRPRNSSAPCGCQSQLLRSEPQQRLIPPRPNPTTHVGVRVVELHQHVGGRRRRDLGVTKDFHLVKNKRLVPGGIESVAHRDRFLGLVEERHNGVGVWRTEEWRGRRCFEGRLKTSRGFVTESHHRNNNP